MINDQCSGIDKVLDGGDYQKYPETEHKTSTTKFKGINFQSLSFHIFLPNTDLPG